MGRVGEVDPNLSLRERSVNSSGKVPGQTNYENFMLKSFTKRLNKCYRSKVEYRKERFLRLSPPFCPADGPALSPLV